MAQAAAFFGSFYRQAVLLPVFFLVTAGSCIAQSDDLAPLAELINARKFKQAQAMADQMAGSHTGSSSFHTLIAELHRLRGDQERAIKELQQAMSLDRKDPKPAVALADIYLANLELDKSLTLAYQAVTTASEYLPGQLKLVEVLLASEQPGEAERQLKFILETQSQNADVQMLVYQLSRKKKDWPAARKALEFVIAHAPFEDPALKLEMAEVLEDSGNVAEARQCLEAAVKANPDSQAAKLALAHILEMKFHDFVPAIKLYRQVLSTDQDNAEALSGLDRAARKQRDVAYRLKLFLYSKYGK